MKYFLRRATENELPSVITCLECGRRFASLTLHVRRIHGLTKVAYIDKYNLPFGTKLASDRTRKRMQSHAIAAESHKNADGSRVDLSTIRMLAFAARIAPSGRPPSPRVRESSRRIAEKYLTPASKERSKRVRTKICAKCGQQFFAPMGKTRECGRRRKYCDDCVKHYGIPSLKCELCSGLFFLHGIGARSRARFCSNSCRYKAMAEGLVIHPTRDEALAKARQVWHMQGTESLICTECGVAFTAHRHKKRKFCSGPCYHASRRK